MCEQLYSSVCPHSLLLLPSRSCERWRAKSNGQSFSRSRIPPTAPRLVRKTYFAGLRAALSSQPACLTHLLGSENELSPFRNATMYTFFRPSRLPCSDRGPSR